MCVAGTVAVERLHLEPCNVLLAVTITEPAALRAIAYNRKAVCRQACSQRAQGVSQRGGAGKALCFAPVAGPQVQAREQGIDQLRVDIGY